MTEEILTLKEVATFLKVAEKTVYTLAQRSELPGFKVGGQWRFRRKDLEAWIDARCGAPSNQNAPVRDRFSDGKASVIPPPSFSHNALPKLYRFGSYEIDDRLYQLRHAGEPVVLEPKAFDLLAYLVRHCDRVVTKEELLAHLWPRQIVTESSLTHCVGKVRKALQGGMSTQSPIRNVYGRGYRFVSPVTMFSPLAARKRKKPHLPRPQRLLSSHPEASASFLRGREYLSQFTLEALVQARRMYEQAIVLDPRYAAAYAALAWTYWFEWTWLWDQEPHTLDRALTLAQQAVALDDSLAVAHLTLGYVYLFRRQHAKAIAEAERSIALAPQYALAHAMLADMLVSVGRPHDAVHLIEKAMRLEPQSTAHFSASLGFAYRALQRYDEAIAALQQTLSRNPNFISARLFLAVLYSETGQRAQAKDELSSLHRLTPQLSVEGLKARLPYQDVTEVEHVLTALRRAGLN